ncbi:MAG: hypothetical protein PVI26_07845 [Chitinispirillia bacterium]|jgi:hypothetical protein
MKKAPLRRPSEFELSRFILGECTHKQKQDVQNWIDSSTGASDEFNKFKKMITDIKIPDAAFKFEPQKIFIFQEIISCFVNRFFKTCYLSWVLITRMFRSLSCAISCYVLITILIISGAVYYKNHYNRFLNHTSKFQNISITKQSTESGRLRDTLEILISTCRSIIQKQQIQCDFSGILDTPCMNRFHSFNQIFDKIEIPLSPVRISSDRTGKVWWFIH